MFTANPELMALFDNDDVNKFKELENQLIQILIQSRPIKELRKTYEEGEWARENLESKREAYFKLAIMAVENNSTEIFKFIFSKDKNLLNEEQRKRLISHVLLHDRVAIFRYLFEDHYRLLLSMCKDEMHSSIQTLNNAELKSALQQTQVFGKNPGDILLIAMWVAKWDKPEIFHSGLFNHLLNQKSFIEWIVQNNCIKLLKIILEKNPNALANTQVVEMAYITKLIENGIGNYELFRLLLNAKPLEKETAEQYTPALKALNKGDNLAFKALLEHQPELILWERDENRSSLPHLAIKSNNRDAVNLMLEMDADRFSINCDKQTYTPIMIAIENADFEILELIFNKKPELLTKTQGYKMHLSAMFAIEKKRIDVFFWLIYKFPGLLNSQCKPSLPSPTFLDLFLKDKNFLERYLHPVDLYMLSKTADIEIGTTRFLAEFAKTKEKFNRIPNVTEYKKEAIKQIQEMYQSLLNDMELHISTFAKLSDAINYPIDRLYDQYYEAAFKLACWAGDWETAYETACKISNEARKTIANFEEELLYVAINLADEKSPDSDACYQLVRQVFTMTGKKNDYYNSRFGYSYLEREQVDEFIGQIHALKALFNAPEKPSMFNPPKVDFTTIEKLLGEFLQNNKLPLKVASEIIDMISDAFPNNQPPHIGKMIKVCKMAEEQAKAAWHIVQTKIEEANIQKLTLYREFLDNAGLKHIQNRITSTDFSDTALKYVERINATLIQLKAVPRPGMTVQEFFAGASGSLLWDLERLLKLTTSEKAITEIRTLKETVLDFAKQLEQMPKELANFIIRPGEAPGQSFSRPRG